jgi:hypothetical protein
MIFDQLHQFRQAAYALLGRGKDALFELMDAVLTTPEASSLVMLSLSPVFRRQWPSIYAALRDGRPQRHKLMRLYIEQMPKDERPLLAGDHTTWPRLEAETLKDRTIEHHPTAITGNKPITIGQGYSTLAWIPQSSGSWALPLRHERITSFETPLSKAAFQLKQVARRLPLRLIALFDREYGNASFANQTAEIEADVMARLRTNLCLWGAPPAYAGKGRPRLHGEKFKLNDPTTWSTPSATLSVDDPQLGAVQVQQWEGLHFRKSPTCSMTVLRIERLPQVGKRVHRAMWLCWWGEAPPPLPELWNKYLRRSAVDHWNRFAKQRLHWTLPKVNTPQQTDRWSDLMPLMSWQLWLAREATQDTPLPWQKPQTELTPGRVAQGFAAILAVLGTPAVAPKPRGKSPGWQPGTPRQPRIRYPVVKKKASKRKKVSENTSQSIA